MLAANTSPANGNCVCPAGGRPRWPLAAMPHGAGDATLIDADGAREALGRGQTPSATGRTQIAGINAGHRWEELVVKLLPRLGMQRSSVPAARWCTAVRLAAVAALAGGLLTAGAAPA